MSSSMTDPEFLDGLIEELGLKGCSLSCAYADRHWLVKVKAKGGGAYIGSLSPSLAVALNLTLGMAARGERARDGGQG